MNSIRISPSIKMPADAVTQTFAFIARKGGGKTYGAMLLAEQMLDLQAQIVVLDIVGNWFGLRLAADGKGKGKDIYILGGSHGDVPLVPHAGAQIAKLLVEKGVSCILDISEFRKGDRKKFACDFAEEFFHLKKTQTSPCHLFVEEAQKLVPQIVRPDEAQMLGAYEDIIRLGRNYGIGCTLISQRPQSINKEALSQTECLVVLQVNGRHERKALEEWVEEAGADRKLVGELPGLAVGEAYIWSPSWLRVFERVKLGHKVTFDSTATPKLGQTRKAPGKLSTMDLSALSASMQQIIVEAEENDPKALRLRIRQLEAELKRGPATKVEPREVVKERRVEVPILKPADLQRIQKSLDRAEKTAEHLAYVGKKIDGTIEVLRKALAWTPQASPSPAPSLKPPPLRHPPLDEFIRNMVRDQDSGSLRRGELRMLSVLAQGYPVKRTRAQLGTLAGFTPSGGTYATYFGNLKRLGYITEDYIGSVEITAKGIEAVGGLDHLEPETPEAALERWRKALRSGEVKMLDALLTVYPDTISREELGERTGFTASGGTFATYLGNLRRNGLIETQGNTVIVTELLGQSRRSE